MMPKIKVSLARRNASKREKLVTGFVIMTAMVFLWIEGTSGALQPNLTSVESWGETQIKVTWQPFEHVGSDKLHFYELYIDDYLEYFGNDLIYIARRLTPDTTYHFKLRSCIQDSQVCSLFSKTLSGTTDRSRKRGFTTSFIHWTMVCLFITIFSCTSALLGAKITRRLWRSFLYRNDYRSETNLQLPKYVASTGTIDEDCIPLLCLKTVPMNDERKVRTEIKSTSNEFTEEKSEGKHGIVANEMKTEKEKSKVCAKSEQTSDMKKNAVQNGNQFQNKQACVDVKNLNSTKESFEQKDLSRDSCCSEDCKSKKMDNLGDMKTLRVFDDMKSNGSTNNQGRRIKNNEISVLREYTTKMGQTILLESKVLTSNSDPSAVETNYALVKNNKAKDLLKCKYSPIDDNTKYDYNTEVPAVSMDPELLNYWGNKERKDNVSENWEIARMSYKDTTERGDFKIQRANSNPKIMRDTNSKRKKAGHRRALSFDSNMQNKKQNESLKTCRNVMTTNHNALTHNTLPSVTHSSDVVIIVDNSNIFIGAQECASVINPNERKRNIRVKIQQLVKVFQRGRVISRAFVQGSSPPTSKQVWEVYRHLGYCVDLEDRRGKDEQRVDEGLHLYIYKALFELSPRTLVIASGDGNKGKSECATSLPGCAEAAIERGWKVEVHSWQHSTSMEWLKLSKRCEEHLTIHYLDRYVNHITFVDGKNGRKCQPLPTEVFKIYEYLN